VYPVRNSLSFKTFSRSSVPQRRATSALSASSIAGSGNAASLGTLIHGSPWCVTIRTPPAPPSPSLASSSSRAVVIRCCREAMNSLGSMGWRSAA
jgi:hypothetical protein